MIDANQLRELEFNSMEEYFDYIADSFINGQIAQTKDLFGRLSAKQRDDFFDYIDSLFHYDADILDDTPAARLRLLLDNEACG